MTTEDFKISKYLLASKRKRFLNFIIDGIIKLIIISSLINFLNLSKVSNIVDSSDRMERYLFWSIVSFIYYGTTELVFSRSPAKFFTKTIVVMKDGSKPNTTTILTRTLLRILPFEALSFLRGRKLGLHDENSKTFVVLKSKLEKQMEEHLQLLSLEKVLK